MWTSCYRIAFLLSAVCLCTSSCREHNADGASYFRAHQISLNQIKFDDGDTFYVDGNPIRVLGIDTPETRSPTVGIMIDQPFGIAAAESTEALVRRAHRIEIVNDGKDPYGRQLAHVFLDGDLLAEKLLAMGLAYETVSHFGDNGFPDLADRILRVAETSPRQKFMPPYKWRKKHQNK